MGLLSIIRKAKRKEHEMRILFLGLDNAGKTTIIRKLMNENTTDISPTMGFTISSLDYRNFHLNIWDIGGQGSIRKFWKNYYEETDAVVWVVDSGDKERLDLCKQQFREILFEEKLMGAAVLILCNKCDLNGAMPVDMITNYLEIKGPEFESRYWSVFSCSAVTGEGLKESFDWLVEHTYTGMAYMDEVDS
ncbi:hypothetical protein WA171_004895 [Blastocystis sp. BT1]